MPGRPSASGEGGSRSTTRSATPGHIPFGAFVLIAAVGLVFAYGLYLKASGPAPAPSADARESSASNRLAEARTGFAADDDGIEHDVPLLPEGNRSQTISPGGRTAPPAPSRPTVPVPTPEPYDREPIDKPETPESPPVRTPEAPPSPPVRTPEIAARPSSDGLAPRGTVPAASRRSARQLYESGDYTAAAQAWDDWAATLPSGTWTVQIAAVNLERAGATGSLGALRGRDDLFVLPAGALPNGLAPVCAGTYDSEAAARRAVAGIGALPGLTGKPLAKPVRSLRPPS